MTQKIFHQDVSKFHVRYFPDSSCKESALINYWREISEVLRVVTFVLNPYGGSRSSAVEIKFPFCLKGLIPKGFLMTGLSWSNRVEKYNHRTHHRGSTTWLWIFTSQAVKFSEINCDKICSWIAQRRTVRICPPLSYYFCVGLNFVHVFANQERFIVQIDFKFSFVQTSCSSRKNFFSTITLRNQKVNGQNSTKNLKIKCLSNWTIKKFFVG